MANATLHKPDGTTERVTAETLEDMQAHVDGYIELVPGTDNVLCNEDGLRREDLQENRPATEKFGANLYAPLIGNVLELDSPLD